MKAVFRRLRRIEMQLAPKPNLGSQRAAELLRDRRRRRLEASGEPFHELQPPIITASGRRLSVAETLRLRRRLAQEPNCPNAVAGQIATDIWS
jgi:hypothetical protein